MRSRNLPRLNHRYTSILGDFYKRWNISHRRSPIRRKGGLRKTVQPLGIEAADSRCNSLDDVEPYLQCRALLDELSETMPSLVTPLNRTTHEEAYPGLIDSNSKASRASVIEAVAVSSAGPQYGMTLFQSSGLFQATACARITLALLRSSSNILPRAYGTFFVLSSPCNTAATISSDFASGVLDNGSRLSAQAYPFNDMPTVVTSSDLRSKSTELLYPTALDY